jgi:hypothetical protein
MVDLVEILLKSKRFNEVVVFSSNQGVDDEGCERFCDVLCERVKGVPLRQITERKSVVELIRLGASASLSVVTRLHAGILAHHGGARVLAVAYQPKVSNVLQEYAIAEQVVGLDFAGLNECCDRVLRAIDIPSMDKGNCDEICTRIDDTVKSICVGR